jgi:hypothetical protein
MDIEAMAFTQFLAGQGRPKVTIVPLIKVEHFLFDLLRQPPVGRLTPLPMQDASIAFLLDPFHQPPHLSGAQPCQFGRLPLADLFFQGLMDEVESFDLTRFHHQ